MKVLASERSSENASRRTTSSNANSKACPFGECDGSGIFYTYHDDGSRTARNCKCVLAEIAKNRLRFANIPAEFEALTVGSFDTDIYGSEQNRNEARTIKKIAIEYVNRFSEMKENGKGLYFYGDTKGSGKTRLAVSIGNALMKQANVPVRYVTTVNLINEIKATWDSGSGGSETELIAAIKRIDVLLLDDIGTEKPSPWVNEMFYNILNERMTSKKVTLFTSNCRIEELKHDSRIVNRILKMAVPVKFPDESVRAALAGKENENVYKMLLGGC